MFKNILVPTDGSELSNTAVRQAVELAKRLDAKITGVYVVPEYHTLSFDTEMVTDTRDQFMSVSEKNANRYLSQIQNAADQQGVNCSLITATGDSPHEEILKTAKAEGCDLIAMASHGWKGLKGLLVGSETQKVLTHAAIPVLVLR